MLVRWLLPPDAGAEVCAGFDGSSTDDHTAIRAETRDGFQFTPRYGPEWRPTIWNPAEWDGQVPRREVHAAVDELARRYRLVRVYCDPREWDSEINGWALTYGDDVFLEWPTNKVSRMFPALRRFVTDLTTGELTHDGCPITATHVANARKAAKPGEQYLLEKPTQHQKIDAAMASALAHEARADALAAGWTRKGSLTRVKGRASSY